MDPRGPQFRPTGVAPRLLCSAGLAAALSLVARSGPAQAPQGVWEAEGYGLLVEIDSTTLTVLQTTSISCMPWWTARRSESDGASNEVMYNRGDARIGLTLGSAPDVLLMREGPSISRVTLRRVANRPARCNETPANTPMNNYAVFWRTYAEQFALFDLYRTDWEAVDRKFRPRVTASTTPEELFGILREMILPFHNAHTYIFAGPIQRRYPGYRDASEIGRRLQASTALTISQILGMVAEHDRRTRGLIESKYAGGPLR